VTTRSLNGSVAQPDGNGAPGVVFRRATPADRDGILEVSACFENDWISHATDWLLGGDESVRVYVGDAAGKIVAVCAAEKFGRAAWLEAMRVRPDSQKRGLATALTRFILDDCRQWGCRAARLSTAVTNAPVHRFIGEKLGFRALGRWVWVDDLEDFDLLAQPPAGARRARDLRPPEAPTPGPTPGSAAVREARPDELDRVWQFLETRFREGRVGPGRLICPPGHRWSLIDFTPAQAETFVREGVVLLAEAGAGAIEGLAVLEPETPYWDPCLAFLEGPPDRARDLLVEVLARTVEDAPEPRLMISLPATQWENIREILRPGWPPDGPSLLAVIYEKDLGQS